MATINRLLLLEDIKLYMRSDSIFSDAQMNKMAEKVITTVGDDDSNYEEILCKSLKSVALNNKAQSTASGGLKSIKIEDKLEESYYQEGGSKSWDDYLDSLDDVCVVLGTQVYLNTAPDLSRLIQMVAQLQLTTCHS